MNQKVEKALELAAQLKERPERWGWRITGVLYGHGKVVVQCVTPKGKAIQFTGKVQ